MVMNLATLLKMNHITKCFAGITALSDVSLEVQEGEVHALIGENGAGKSTLIKIITGAYQADEGTIEYNGTAYTAMTPQLSTSLGISAIYQEFNLAPTLSVAENIFMGIRLDRSAFVDYKLLYAKADEILKIFDIKFSAKELVQDLSVAYKQMVEIAKALAKGAKLLIMDEPTAPLTEHEVEILFGLIDRLKQQGVTIIYISHRLDELFRICDTLTVMRDGKVVADMRVAETNKQALIYDMVGRKLSESFPSRNIAYGDTALEVRHLNGINTRDLSFTLKEGEILGFAGLVGAGRTESARLIFGADRMYSGEIYMRGKKVDIRSPKDAVRCGIGLVPEDRKLQGVILSLSIQWNITLPILYTLTKWGFIDREKENACVNQYKNALRIKAASLFQQVSSLSGGNQQKVAVSKWLARKSKVLILDEPTRGIDVGAKQEIYQLINTLAESGIAVIIISSDMEEILGMSDRLLIMHEGNMVKELDKGDFSQEKVLYYASGEK